MDLGEPAAARHVERFFELGAGLAGKADDDVGGKRQRGAGRAQAVHQRHVVGAAVGPRHGVQHGVASRLQRQVHLAAHAPFRRRQDVHERIVHVARLDAGDAEAARRLALAMQAGRLVEQAFQEAGQAQGARFAAAALAVRPQVDACEHDLAHPGARIGHALGDHLVGRTADRAPARHVDDAVGAGVVAPVLHLHAHTRGKALPRPQ